jgi:hypothetical protein
MHPKEPAPLANFILDLRKRPCAFIMLTMKFFIFAATECKKDGIPFLKRPTLALRQPMILGALYYLLCELFYLALISVDSGYPISFNLCNSLAHHIWSNPASLIVKQQSFAACGCIAVTKLPMRVAITIHFKMSK